MSELTFYTNPMSRGRIARWMLEETGMGYTTEIIEFGSPMHSPEFKSVNPMAKVPAIHHRNTIITETAAICAYLADTFPDVGLAPASGSPERGPYYRWLFFGAGPIEQATVNESFGWTLDNPMDRGRTGYGSLGRVCRMLDAHLGDGRAYLLGDNFSAADVFVGSQIAFGLQSGLIPKEASFSSYVARLSTRPAYLSAKEKDDALVSKGNS